jgi:hypothetical protein
MEEQGVEGVGFGWINLHKVPGFADGGPDARRELLEWPYDVEQPIAPAIAAWGAAVRASVGPETRLVRPDDVQQETVGAPGAEDPSAVVLRQQRGLRRARQVDTVTAALVGACDGDLTVGQLLDAISELLGLDPAGTRATYEPIAEELVAEGFLVLADG